MESSNSYKTVEVVRDIPMDISPAFYPLPNVPLPTTELKPPTEIKYDFSVEHAAIAHYKEEQSKNDKTEPDDPVQRIARLSYLSITRSSKNNSQQSGDGSANPANGQPLPASVILPSWTPPQLL